MSETLLFENISHCMWNLFHYLWLSDEDFTGCECVHKDFTGCERFHKDFTGCERFHKDCTVCEPFHKDLQDVNVSI